MNIQVHSGTHMGDENTAVRGRCAIVCTRVPCQNFYLPRCPRVCVTNDRPTTLETPEPKPEAEARAMARARLAQERPDSPLCILHQLSQGGFQLDVLQTRTKTEITN